MAPKKIKRICIECGEEFEVWPSQLNHGGAKYCSHACAARSRGSPPLKLICQYCGNVFEVNKPSRIVYGEGKYCSSECRSKSQCVRSELICEQCGKSFKVQLSKAKDGRKYCSKECFQRGISGAGNSRWRGGLSYGKYCIKFNAELKERVREEFGRKCFLCGESENGRKLSVHHVDYQKSQGCNGYRWALIPLCTSCHTKTNFNRWHWFNLLRDYWLYEQIDFVVWSPLF